MGECVIALSTLQSDRLEGKWNEIEPFVKRVLSKIDLYYTVEYIKESLLRAEMQLWTSFEGTQIKSICITQIQIHPKYKFLDIVLQAGQLASVEHSNQIEQWGKSQGCTKVKLTGRRGWKRVLPDYKETLIKLEKEL